MNNQHNRKRIVNYSYLQAEQIASIGLGAVESAIKQIDEVNAVFILGGERVDKAKPEQL